jgi:CheY-like chemotaxis protein
MGKPDGRGMTAVVRQAQHAAVEAWNREVAEAERMLERQAVSREMRRDARLRLEALQRADRALQRHSAPAKAELHPMPVAVVVHRNEWMREKLVTGLIEAGMDVVAAIEDGADALGIAIAEQPDVVVLEDRLTSLTGFELAEELRRYTKSLLAAQVAHDDEIGPMLDAGASAVFTRRVPPAVIVEEVLALVNDRGRGPVTVQ